MVVAGMISPEVSAHEFQQVRDGSVRFDRVPEFGPFADQVMIAPANSGAFDNLGLLKLGYDLLDRPLSNANLESNLPKQNVRITVQTKEHVGVVRKKGPRIRCFGRVLLGH